MANILMTLTTKSRFWPFPLHKHSCSSITLLKIGNYIDTTGIITIANHDRNYRKKEEVGNNGKRCSLVTTTVT